MKKVQSHFTDILGVLIMGVKLREIVEELDFEIIHKSTNYNDIEIKNPKLPVWNEGGKCPDFLNAVSFSKKWDERVALY